MRGPTTHEPRRPTRGRILAGLVALAGIACGRPSETETHEPAHAAGRQEVRLSEAALRAAGIEVIAVGREAFHPHIVASGVIRPVAKRSAVVRSMVAGRVVRILADVGDQVRAGATLATIEGPEVTAALARHRTAGARHAAALQARERAERLLEMKAISKAELEQRHSETESTAAEAEAARQDLVRLGLDPGAAAAPGDSLAEFPVHAPLSGVVLARSASPGLLVEREGVLFDLADLTQVWAVVDLYEKDLGQVEEQGDVEVRTDAYPGTVFQGRISLIEPALDEASRTAHLRVELENRSGKLRPGLFVTAALPVRGVSDVEATAVPDEALQTISGLPAVFVEKEPGLYELRPVETGSEAHGMVEIRHGLRDGERVVSRGAFILKSEILKGTIAGEDH